MKAKLVISADLGRETIDKCIYGHFAEHLGRCIYDGIWVGPESDIPNVRGIRTDIVDALRGINIPVLRWPGGCFADEYHWMDGVGPRDERPAMLNTHWGGVTENNHFGTHEFLDLCDQLGCEPYICGNVGSGTVQEMKQWVEYTTFGGRSPMADLRRANGREAPWKIKYWGVGNENWGCGGSMLPEYYADLYRRFQTYLRDLSGNALFKIACGSTGPYYRWTDVLMRKAGRAMAGLSLHYYTVPRPRPNRGSATVFDEEGWFLTLKKTLVMEDLLDKHGNIMDRYDPEKRVALIVDEWGTWYDVEPGTRPRFLYQQNTLRDALVAGINLNSFNQHCDRVRMANIAQTVNVLQAMVLTQGDEIILTPTYHVFDMYKVHQDATLLPIDVACGEYDVEGVTVPPMTPEQARQRPYPIDLADLGASAGGVPTLSVSASRNADGMVHVSICNLDPNNEVGLACHVHGMDVTAVTGRVLTSQAMNAHNTFEAPQQVRPEPYSGVSVTAGGLKAVLPPKSVVVLAIT